MVLGIGVRVPVPQSMMTRNKHLIKEIKAIQKLLGLTTEGADPNTLASIKEQYIRGEIIMTHTLIDQFFDEIIRKYFFRKKVTLSRERKFAFQVDVLGKISFLNKLRFVKRITKMPRELCSDIEKLNELRNAIAHTFATRIKSKNISSFGKNAFTFAGLKLFLIKRKRIWHFLFSKTGRAPENYFVELQVFEQSIRETSVAGLQE